MLPEQFDLTVHGGTLVIPGTGLVVADVGVREGRIVAIGEHLSPGAEAIDARGRLVLPGLFDPHTHIGIERSFEEETVTETRAAVLGGVTTIGIFLRSIPDSYLDHLPAFRAAMDETSYVDSVFHPQIFNAQQLAEIPECAAQYGIRSFKFYMSGMPGVLDPVGDDFLLDGFRAVAALGPDAVACVHCETGALIDQARAALKARRAEGTVADWAEAHPPEAEALAIRTASYLAAVAGAHLYVVHLSSQEGVETVRALKREGANITVETTTPYLGLSSDDPNGFKLKMVPPIRAKAHGAALWGAVRDGLIDTLGTDNTSRSLSTKKPEAGLHGARPGLPVLGTHLPVLLHHGRRHGIPLETLIDKATRQPAMTYGIYPRKGTIMVGSDADLVVVDPTLEKVVSAQALRGMSDFSPFEGHALTGWPVMTIKGGVVIARDGEIVGAPNGRYLPRTAPAGDGWPASAE